jgi:hypothetical protein
MVLTSVCFRSQLLTEHYCTCFLHSSCRCQLRTHYFLFIPLFHHTWTLHATSNTDWLSSLIRHTFILPYSLWNILASCTFENSLEADWGGSEIENLSEGNVRHWRAPPPTLHDTAPFMRYSFLAAPRYGTSVYTITTTIFSLGWCWILQITSLIYVTTL